jgi:hypothetical protein
LDYAENVEPFSVGGQGRLQALLVLAGKGRLVLNYSEEVLTPGQVWLLPAALRAAECRPDGGLAVLCSTLPKD